ncbi:MAG: type II toxin-antitoxin system RelE/ParE family toxin [Pyrinomonadaceae bacterium]
MTWRIRIGEYRVIYSIIDSDIPIEIITVAHRSQAYD